MDVERKIVVVELPRQSGQHRWYRAQCPDCSWLIEARDINTASLELFADAHAVRGH